MSMTFKANPSDLHALAEFLTNAAELSRDTGVWFCVYGPVDVVIPGGTVVRVGVDGQGDEQAYVIDDRIGD